MSIVPGRDVPAVPEEWTDAVNKAINDAFHEDLCLCDGWPDACASGYESGRWDLGVSLTIAVGTLAPLMRARESERGDHWKRVATEIEQDRDRLADEVRRLSRALTDASRMAGVASTYSEWHALGMFLRLNVATTPAAADSQTSDHSNH